MNHEIEKDSIPEFNIDGVIMDLTQCCGARVWILTDYSEGGETLIPICVKCKTIVTVNGEIRGEEE